MAAHTRLVRLATWLTALSVGACTEDFDSFVVAEPDAGAGGAQGGASGQAGATSSGGQPGTGGASTGGASPGGATGQGGSSQCKASGEQCHDDPECCDQHCVRGWDTDDRDCNEQDRCAVCSGDDQCPSGRCDNCGCEEKLDKGASCNEDSDCKSNNCAGMKCG